MSKTKTRIYIKIGNKWAMSTILQMRLTEKVKLGTKAKRRDYSNYSNDHREMLMRSMQHLFGIDNAKMVIEYEEQ